MKNPNIKQSNLVAQDLPPKGSETNTPALSAPALLSS